MDFNNQGGFRPRETHKAGDADGCTGGWACSKCGAAIQDLPFKPDPSRVGALLCRDCHRQRVQNFRR